MLNLTITATGRDGKLIAEQSISAETREACLVQGIAEILAQNNFPPEALELYRRGMAGGFSRDECCDQLLNDFGLQFFARDGVAEQRVAPVEERMKPAANGAAALPSPAAEPISIAALNRSPRQLLQSELKEIRLLLSKSGLKLKEAQKEYDFLVQRAEQCRELLKPRPRPRIVRKAGEHNG